ncbi:LysR family transcriptional regulator [Robertmurraya massiliosenegalensis]|uniref:cidABC operon transcriptional activator CidR n=1 Tax=Robertmurraya TaxID=2837507 RepID=UPI0039A73A37
MDIKHLQYFIEVVHANSFSRAADNLYITQPTISKMIKNFEEEVGVPLFERSRKQLTLTDAGKLIFEQATLINRAYHNLENELDNLLGLKKGHIRIGLPPIFNAHLFLKIVSSFHEKYPGITFQLMEQGSKKIEEAVEKNLLDVGIVVLPTQTDIFEHLALKEEDFRVILHKSHPFAVRKEVELAELANESFITYNRDFVLNDRILHACQSVGFTPNIISESSQRSFIEDMVSWKLGIALIPESICHNLNHRIKAIKVINPSIKWKLGIIWSKHHYLSFAAKEWLSFTKEKLKEEKTI